MLARKFFVYIVKCSDDSLYTGFTTDPARRVQRHNRGQGSRYTRSRRPVELVFLRDAGSRSEALSLERAVKKLTRKEKLLICQKYAKEEEPGLR